MCEIKNSCKSIRSIRFLYSFIYRYTVLYKRSISQCLQIDFLYTVTTYITSYTLSLISIFHVKLSHHNFFVHPLPSCNIPLV